MFNSLAQKIKLLSFKIFIFAAPWNLPPGAAATLPPSYAPNRKGLLYTINMKTAKHQKY
jgi:hypothetical protein